MTAGFVIVKLEQFYPDFSLVARHSLNNLYGVFIDRDEVLLSHSECSASHPA